MPRLRFLLVAPSLLFAGCALSTSGTDDGLFGTGQGGATAAGGGAQGGSLGQGAMGGTSSGPTGVGGAAGKLGSSAAGPGGNGGTGIGGGTAGSGTAGTGTAGTGTAGTGNGGKAGSGTAGTGTAGTGTAGSGTAGTGQGGTSSGGKGGTGTAGSGTAGTGTAGNGTGGTGTAGSGAGGSGTSGSGTGGTGTAGSSTGGSGIGGSGAGGSGAGGTSTGGAGNGGSGGMGGSGGGGPCTTAPGACVAALPAGWTLAAYEASRAAACPAGYTQDDIVASPVAGAGACGCDCAFDSPPSCTKGMVPTQYGFNSCSQNGATLNVDGSGCASLGFVGTLQTHFSATPAPATSLACTASTLTDASKVTTSDQRVCHAPTACEEDVCSGIVDAGFQACIVHDGDQACPSGWPTKTVVGGAATLSCAACTGCTGTADCTDEKVQFFSDANCNNAGPTLAANTMCVASSQSVVAAYKYTATVSNAKCDGTGPKTATPGLTKPQTVCCK